MLPALGLAVLVVLGLVGGLAAGRALDRSTERQRLARRVAVQEAEARFALRAARLLPGDRILGLLEALRERPPVSLPRRGAEMGGESQPAGAGAASASAGRSARSLRGG